MTTATLPAIRTSVGKKAVMALTGLVLFGFVVAHMAGNLKLFSGRDHFNEYGEFLRTLGSPAVPREYALWGLRSVLLLCVVAHIAAAVSLSRQSLAARPIGYAKKRNIGSSYASRTMRWGGVILAAFIVYHLLHMTTGTVHPNFAHGEPYDNMINAFQDWWIWLAYAVAVGALALHVFHGFWSLFQTLGRGSGRSEVGLRSLAAVLAGVLFAGYLLGPTLILLGEIP